jgi:hypothetical protein
MGQVHDAVAARRKPPRTTATPHAWRRPHHRLQMSTCTGDKQGAQGQRIRSVLPGCLKCACPLLGKQGHHENAHLQLDSLPGDGARLPVAQAAQQCPSVLPTGTQVYARGSQMGQHTKHGTTKVPGSRRACAHQRRASREVHGTNIRTCGHRAHTHDCGASGSDTGQREQAWQR